MEEITEARVFHPSPEDFKDLSSYIEKLHEQKGEETWIIKIVPPGCWKAWKQNAKGSAFLETLKIKLILQSVTKISDTKGI